MIIIVETLGNLAFDEKVLESLPGRMKKSKFVALNKQVEKGLTEEQKLEEAA